MRTPTLAILPLLLLALGLACAAPGGPGAEAPGHGAAAAAPPPPVHFPRGEAAADAFVDDSAQPYFALLQPLEMSVKTGRPIAGDTLAAQQAETRRRYRAAVRDFTPAEEAALRTLVARVQPWLREATPKLAEADWAFLKVAPPIEGGLPHTRGPYIVLPVPLVAALTRAVEVGSAPGLLPFEALLLHERVHVVQRAHPELFTPLYEEVWGLEHVERIAEPPELTRRQVTNPDATDLGWVLPLPAEAGTPRYVWPRLLFAPGLEAPRMPQDFTPVAVRLVPAQGPGAEGGLTPALDAQGHPRTTPLDEEPAWTRAIPPVTSRYHPNEAAADAITQALMAEYALPPNVPAIAEQRAEMLLQVAAEREWMREGLR